MITVYAVEWGPKGIVALFKDEKEAQLWANAHIPSRVYPWSIPAETFEFEE